MGYARALDLARLMHALHAAILELDLDVWFEYVRTAANIADEPSRVDMGTEVFDIYSGDGTRGACYACRLPFECAGTGCVPDAA